ncbi:actin-related protein 1-like [Corticium candelabrum]|uniref:actin-related protein 1-like n=1 Tax=Corticium candelabrum TaxID=121492 RepID=UPI002E27195A|nr:actin-related protein 1-like [Corticium candelabrum]
MFEKPDNGISDAIYYDVEKHNPELRKKLYFNIFLCGGGSMLPSFEERLDDDLKRLTRRKEYIRVNAAPHRQCSAWIGANILVNRMPDVLKKLLVTRSEYQEEGAKGFERKLSHKTLVDFKCK